VVRPSIEVELEPVSRRLKTALMHPAKTDRVLDPHFSLDGKRILARSYPSNVVQLWDVDSGKQLTAIETEAGRLPNYHVATNWSTLYVSRYNRKSSQVEREGKRLFRVDYESDVQAWDLATAKRTDTLRFTPSRGIHPFRLSPDGETLVTFERRSGEFEQWPPPTASLWDVKTRSFRALPEGLDGVSAQFSADGKTLLASLLNDRRRLVAWKLFDVATATEKQSFPAPLENSPAGRAALSPDGRFLAANVYSPIPDESLLTLWETATARELISFNPEDADHLSWPVFSPDGRQLVVSTFNTEPTNLYLFDLATRTLSGTVSLGPKALSFGPTFSPDGRWIVAVTQVYPDDVRSWRYLNHVETPQARIYVIDAASGELCETLIAPQGLVRKASFRPDGAMFATGTTGKVLLWDFRQPPVTAQQSRR